MTELTWESLAEAPRHAADTLEPDGIPDAPGVYAWWRDGEPRYVDCARRLQIRLTRIDTHVAGTWSRRSTLRSRIALLLREEGDLADSADGEEQEELVNDWVSHCSVSWITTSSYEDAESAVLSLLSERRPQLHIWRPRYGEDEWLLEYVERLGGRDQAGKFYVEVPIGGVTQYGKGAKTRFIDAVRLPQREPSGIYYYHRDHFERDLSGQPVEVIEVKRGLNRTVIGQLLIAKDLAQAEWPHGTMRLVTLCTQGDPALEWICEERGIDLELVPRDSAT